MNAKDDPVGAYSGFSRDAISGVVTWCWGSTKVACESGFAGAPYGTDKYLDTATQLCSDYRANEGVDVCWAEAEGACAYTACHGKITTVAGSPAPLPSGSGTVNANSRPASVATTSVSNSVCCADS